MVSDEIYPFFDVDIFNWIYRTPENTGLSKDDFKRYITDSINYIE